MWFPAEKYFSNIYLFATKKAPFFASDLNPVTQHRWVGNYVIEFVNFVCGWRAGATLASFIGGSRKVPPEFHTWCNYRLNRVRHTICRWKYVRRRRSACRLRNCKDVRFPTYCCPPSTHPTTWSLQLPALCHSQTTRKESILQQSEKSPKPFLNFLGLTFSTFFQLIRQSFHLGHAFESGQLHSSLHAPVACVVPTQLKKLGRA